MPAPKRVQPPPARIQIESPQPLVDCGRYAAKRSVGDTVGVRATIFRDGHDVLRAVVRYRGPDAAGGPDDAGWEERPLRRIDAHLDGDTWAGEFEVDACGTWEWSITAWTDAFASWRDELGRKVAFGQTDLAGELSEGVVLLRDAATRATGDTDRARIETARNTLEDPEAAPDAQYRAALDADLFAAISRYSDRRDATSLATPVRLEVDRVRARFGAWYELFPRSWGGFKGVEAQIPRLAELGFDVLYLPPIHPIGETNRKGRNTAEFPGGNPVAQPGEPGSPWAIGHHAIGGHDAIHPDLGTLEEFDSLVRTGREHGVEICLDFAIQCSADHPWLTEHPEWFNRRPDGSLKYAENPPKKYQDIYNVDFGSEDWRGLWDALHAVLRHWVDHGVRCLRVDNPHTKSLPFWEWVIGEIRATHPDVIFLAEAFTRAAMMKTLAKAGFSQSYTYFTWKNSRWELQEYVSELAHSEMAEYYRPNFFANTPDILNEYLVSGGPPAFSTRLLLAATLSPTYGIYSGFESFENVPVRPGSEEYEDSEKYVVKQRSLDGPLLPFIAAVNRIRREHPALQRLDNVTFLDTENDALIAYAKRAEGSTLICVVNLDPHHAQEGLCVVPYELGLPPAFSVTDLLSEERFDWRIGRNYVRLDPVQRAGHVLKAESR
ncbi:MAG TPA: alpha-1,4-glucan--maltose-1-phosphate maltosyltransferase [Solirubrobacteraceae bacterium]